MVYFWNKFKKQIQVNFKGEKYCVKIKFVKWWKCDDLISDGKVVYELERYGIYKKVEFRRVARQKSVRIMMLKNGRIKLINEFDIDHRNKKDPLKIQIDALRIFQNSQKLILCTDAGVHLETGKATCGIIVGDGTNEVELKIRLLDLDPGGSTTGEMLSITTGLHLMWKANLNKVAVVIYNDNQDAVKAVITKPSVKEAIGNNGWGKSKIWEEVKKFKDVGAEWSRDDSTRRVTEHKEVLMMVKWCHKLAHEKYMDCAIEAKELSISIGGNIECFKLGSTVIKLIGNKYVDELLMKKYQLTSDEVYLQSRRKAIKCSGDYLKKTANGLNLVSEKECFRGNHDAVCPVCQQSENWLHVAKCCSSTEENINS